jgi:hypothetical protein
MNRIIAHGIATEARDYARRVVIVVSRRDVALTVDLLTADGNPSLLEKVSRAKGRELVQWITLGRVDVVAATAAIARLRGMSPDLVYIDDPDAAHSEQFMDELRPLMATGAEVLR